MKNDNKTRKRREIRESLKQSITDWCNKANELYRGKARVKVPRVFISKFCQRNESWACVLVRSNGRFIKQPLTLYLHPNCLKPDWVKEYLTYTIPHEIAHIVQVELLKKRFGAKAGKMTLEPHSNLFASVMKKFGVKVPKGLVVNTSY